MAWESSSGVHCDFIESDAGKHHVLGEGSDLAFAAGVSGGCGVICSDAPWDRSDWAHLDGGFILLGYGGD